MDILASGQAFPLWEARSTRDRARSASRQGNVMVVFTTVTIIFLPLSFMAALFAVSIETFPQLVDGSGNTSFRSGVIALYLGIAVAIILPFVATAFFTRWIAKQYHRLLNACLIPLAIGTLHLLSTFTVAGIAKWSKRSIKRLKVHRQEYYGRRFTTNLEVANKSFLYDQSPLGLPSGGSEAPSHSGSEH
jgi:predicted tellurium resistance membrane protein TerC